MKKPKVVCLCGSSKFKKEFEKAIYDEELAGNIVLSIGCFTHHDKLNITASEKEAFDVLHLHKINMSDEIFVLNVGGYVGESTENEVDYAGLIGKHIRWLEDPKKEMNEICSTKC